MKTKIFTLSFCAFLFFSSGAFAAGIGAKPASLDFTAAANETAQKKILVYNLSQEPAIFRIFPDGFKEWIRAEPDSFRLEANENREVIISILAEKNGSFTSNISIISSPIDRGGFSALPGIKIPLRLNIEKEKPHSLYSLFAASVSDFFRRDNIPDAVILAVFLLAILFFAIRAKKIRKK